MRRDLTSWPVTSWDQGSSSLGVVYLDTNEFTVTFIASLLVFRHTVHTELSAITVLPHSGNALTRARCVVSDT